MILCIHGHKPDKIGGWNQPNPVSKFLQGKLREHLEETTPTGVIVGGDLGVPQWAAFLCIELGIPFNVVVPNKGFSSKWPPHSQAIYQQMCSKAASVQVISQHDYKAGDIYKRNVAMVKLADRVTTVWDGSQGITAHVHEEAKSANKIHTWITLAGDMKLLADTTYAQLKAKKGAPVYPPKPVFAPTPDYDFGKVKALLGIPDKSPKKVDPWAFKNEDAPQEDRPQGTVVDKFAPKRVVEID